MIQEYLIKDEVVLRSIKDYSSEKISQVVTKIESSLVLSISMTGENEDNAKM